MENTPYKILLIEDDKLDQMAFTRMVEQKELPYDCTITGSVAQAKSILSTERFDIVISDYSLGDGTAFEVLKLVNNTPVILVTGAGDEDVAITAWKAGVYDYLIKDHERNYLKAIPKTIENVAKYKKMEQRLRLLSHAIVSTDDCVYITDLEDRITFVNRAFCETYGYKEEEIVGQDCSILWKNNGLAEGNEKNYRAVSGWEVGFFHIRKDGSQFPVSLTSSNVKDESGKEVALVVIARDISERMEIESELRIANRDIEEQNRLRKELAVAVCNELTTLIPEIKNIISDAIAGTNSEISDSLKKNFERVDRNIKRATDILNNFVEISQTDTGNLTIEMAEAGLRLVVAQILQALAPLAAEHNFNLEAIMHDPESNKNVEWNKIVRTLTNLVSQVKDSVAVNSSSKQ